MKLRGSRILVTGGAGFVGSNLVPKLVACGASVRTTLHRREPVYPCPDVEYVRVDLEQAANCTSICEGMDIVVLAAANSSGAGVMAETPLVHLTPNLIMNARMLEAAYAAGVQKLLFISSNTVYPLTDFAVKETDVTNEFYESYYIVGWMKRFSEIMCDMYSSRVKKPMTTIVIRPSNIYGPYDKYDWTKSKVIAALIRRVAERQNPIEVWGDGRDVKDFIYIDDFVAGLVLALEKLDETEIMNIASGVPVTVRDVLNTLLRVDRFTEAQVRYDPTKPTMIPKRLMDNSRAREKLGFEAQTTLEEGLRQTLNWYRADGFKLHED